MTTAMSPKALRQFGLTLGAAFIIWGGLLLWRASSVGRWPCLIGLALIGMGLAIPKALEPVYTAWMAFAERLGWVMTRVILTVVFYLVITPTGLIVRLVRKPLLERRPNPTAASYWMSRQADVPDRQHYEQQF